MSTPCRCGYIRCVHRNRAFFFRRPPAELAASGEGSRAVRAGVFKWPFRDPWTWCPVIDGEYRDDGQVMGHYDSWELAYADAYAWIAGRYGAERIDTKGLI